MLKGLDQQGLNSFGSSWAVINRSPVNGTDRGVMSVVVHPGLKARG